MNILLVNDDGFEAKGLEIMSHALSQFGKVYVCAPKTHQSARSHAISIHDRIHAYEVDAIKYAQSTFVVDGTPVDCVRMGLKVFNVDFDLVVSGINDGNNVGKNIMYSGTVAAAVEAKILGIHAFAISCSDVELDYIYDECVKIVDELLENKLYIGNFILNINFPKESYPKPLGIKLTEQGKRYLHAEYIESEKKDIYFIKYSEVLYIENEDSDIEAYDNGYISITPITDERTSFQGLKSLQNKM